MTLFKDINTPVLKNQWKLASKILVPCWFDDKHPTQIKERIAIEKARNYPSKDAEICFFGGCGHTHAIPNSVYGTISILKNANIDHITIGNTQFCCGVVYIIMRYLNLWLEHTYNVMQSYLKLSPRPKKTLLHCPGCYTIYQFDLSQYGLILPLNYLRIMKNPIQMMHVSQYILELIKNNKINLKYKISLSITYHDNCSIGRKMARVGKSVYDEPREILKKIPCINLIEAKDTRNDAYCCGAITTKTFGLGTDLNLFKKDKSYYIHKELFEYLINNGSNNLVTPCMGCAIIYEDSSRTLSPKLGKKINILELSELVNKSMGIKIPKRYFDHNNLISLSPPFIKFSAIKILPRLIKNHAFKDLFKFIKDITIYILKKRK